MNHSSKLKILSFASRRLHRHPLLSNKILSREVAQWRHCRSHAPHSSKLNIPSFAGKILARRDSKITLTSLSKYQNPLLRGGLPDALL